VAGPEHDRIEPFAVRVDEDVLADVRGRLERARFPVASPATGWSEGTPQDYLAELVGYWLNEYDWRDNEARLNMLPQFRTVVDGLGIHFVHARSTNPDALPLLMTHGWPGSVWEFQRIISLLVDPTRHGGDADDAFHVVCPSLPGYAFSDPPAATGCDPRRIAAYEAALMSRLGYERYGAQGGDWGARISAHVAGAHPCRVIGLHLNFPGFISPPPDFDTSTLDSTDLQRWHRGREFVADGMAYLQLQATRPQSLAYGLSDSPLGLAGWLVEKFQAWSDCAGDPSNVLSRDELITNIMIYWCTNSIGSSIRLYREHNRRPWNERVDVRAACALFPAETSPPIRAWVEGFLNIRQWSEFNRGGHFAALEQPELLAEDIRRFFRPLRAGL
jgi:pimeloyl-ACP methyl ester carboxylesterase